MLKFIEILYVRFLFFFPCKYVYKEFKNLYLFLKK
jgi:hypothetical protein